jgi:electron transfer flavoprotein alpha subunit
MTILVLAEHDENGFNPALLHVLDAARRIGGDVHVLFCGPDAITAANAAAAIAGVAKVLHADAPHLAPPVAENLAATLADVAKRGGYSHVLAAATGFGKNVVPRAAALLDVAPVSEVIAIESPDTFVRPIYAGNALATVQAKDAIKLLTVRPTAFDAVAATGGSGAVERVDAVADAGLCRVVAREIARSERPDLANARIVISGGRGIGSKENFQLLETLADRLGAAIGASRAAVDAGYAPNDHQVGQTGKVVAPDLYIAVGISGAIQHLAGMKDSKVIVAINKDPEAPIFQIADYGLVGDLFELIPQLTAELSAA